MKILSYNDIQNNIKSGAYKTKQEGIRDIQETYKRGFLAKTEKEDLLTSLNWYFIDKNKKYNNSYIVLY